MFGGSSREARRPFNSFGPGTARLAGRLDAMTGKLPADQGRAPQLYDEQLQRLQQEKMLLRRVRDSRPDLLERRP
jgi:hypothetical protein